MRPSGIIRCMSASNRRRIASTSLNCDPTNDYKVSLLPTSLLHAVERTYTTLDEITCITEPLWYPNDTTHIAFSNSITVVLLLLVCLKSTFLRIFKCYLLLHHILLSNGNLIMQKISVDFAEFSCSHIKTSKKNPKGQKILLAKIKKIEKTIFEVWAGALGQ